MKQYMLNDEWSIKGVSPSKSEINLCGTVPGSALNDIINSKGIDKSVVFFRDRAEEFQKYENYDWVYTKKFIIDDDIKKADLVFEKVDTYCDIYFNNKHLGYCDNAFIRHSFTIENIPKGENTIEVYFYSPITALKGKKYRNAAFGSFDRLYARRTQCTYGWDWTMRFVTCGISGDVYIDVPEESIKIKSAYVYTKNIDDYSAAIGIDVYTEDFESGAVLCYEIYDDRGQLVQKVLKYCEEEFVRIDLDIVNPKLWYPLGYGEPHLYRLAIKSQDKELYSAGFGIRTVKILEVPDEVGGENYNKCIKLKKSEFALQYDENTEFSSFTLMVNGIKIMCKGANWVPCEPFASGNTDKKVTKLLELAKEAGVNMIRVWGGGDFETEHFYDECSRLGIMVTQDFLMACGQYPEDEQWFIDQLKKEAQYIAEKIRNKPCLMWWTGDNENAAGGHDTDKKYNGRASAYKGVAPVLYKMDPYRRFLPSSPYGGAKYASNTVGTTHNTQFLNSFFKYIEESDVKEYKEFFKLFSARFIAEEPCLGAVSEQSLKRFMTDEDIYGDTMEMWKYHTKTNPGLRKEIFDYILIFAEKLLGKFKNPQDRLFKLQYLQYEWVRVSLERVRREKWFCSGVIYWMFNDCWPAAAGWALIDYYGTPKAGYYSFKRGAKPIVLSVDLIDDTYMIYVSNDGESERVALKWYAISDKGEITYASQVSEIDIPANTSMVGLKIEQNELPADCFIVAEITNGKGIYDRAFYKKGNLEIYCCNDKIKVLSVGDGCVKVKADTYVHAVELEGDALFEENFFMLMKGETKEIRYTQAGDGEITVTAYTFQK